MYTLLMNETAIWELFDAQKWEELRHKLTADPGSAAIQRGGVSLNLMLLFYGQIELAREIAGKRSDLNPYEAAVFNDRAQLQTALDADSTLVNTPSADGFPLLHLAASFGGVETTQLLIDIGAKIDAFSTHQFVKNTAVSAACFAQNPKTLELLLKSGANPDATAEGGFRAIHLAAENNRLDLGGLLHRYGADINAVTDDGQCAESIASSRGHEEFLDFLSRT